MLVNGQAIDFVIDSGADEPLCKDKHAFTGPLRYDHTPIYTASGEVIYSQGIGRIGNFDNIYYVPELQLNLLSVSYLNNLGLTVTFYAAPNKIVSIKDLQGNEQLIGQNQNGLFHTVGDLFSLQAGSTHYALSLILPSANTISHQRCMHLNVRYITTAHRLGLVHGLHCSSSEHRFMPFCDACALAKSHAVSSSFTPGSSHRKKRKVIPRSPSPTSPLISIPSIISSASVQHDSAQLPTSIDFEFDINSETEILSEPIFDSIDNNPSHPCCKCCKFAVDLKGPLPLSIKKTRYICLFTCTCTRYRKAYHLKTKNETADAIKDFLNSMKRLNQIVTHIDFQVTTLKSDNGTEFINAEVREILRNENVNHQTSSPYSPFQNGIAERSNLTIVELAVASMLGGNVPMYLYPYAIDAVIFILTVMPCEALNMQSTPHIELFNEIPDISWLRAYGCDAYIHLPDHQRASFGARAVKGILIGYGLLEEPSSLAYLIYYPPNRTVYKCGHAHFNEDLSTRQTDNEIRHELEQFYLAWNPPSPNIEVPQIMNLVPVSETIQSVTAPTLAPTPSAPLLIPPTIPTEANLSSETATNLASNKRLIASIDQSEFESTSLKRSERIAARKPLQSKYTSSLDITTEDAMNAILSGRWYDSSYALIDLSAQDPNTQLVALRTEIHDSINSPSYEEAKASPEWPKWEAAIITELNKLITLGTWKIVDKLPAGRKPIRFKWVLKLKKDFDTLLNIYKARLTAKGCAQIPGLDFKETFAPVAKLSTVRLLLSIGAFNRYFLWQMDVNAAFPNAVLPEDVDVYMFPPTELNLPPGSYLQLVRALYGLKQASREWHLTVATYLKSIGFKSTYSDSCVFHITQENGKIIIILYVDDFIVLATHMHLIEGLFSSLSTQYSMKQKPLTECLGFHINYNRTEGQLSISRDDYMPSVFKKFGHYIKDISYVSVPVNPSTRLSRSMCPQDEATKIEMEQLPYRSLVGCFNYLNCILRADISYGVNLAAQYMDNPGPEHWQALLQVFAYLRDHPSACITYGRNVRADMPMGRLILYVDSDWAGTDIDTYKSITGYIIYFNGGIISWKTSKQKTNSASSTEAEYKALFEGTSEAVGLYRLLVELSYTHSAPILVYEDNSSAIRASVNPVEHSKLKHIETKFHCIRDFVSQNLIEIVKVDTKLNRADAFTKPLGPSDFHTHTDQYINVAKNAHIDLNFVRSSYTLV